jgi:cytochrome P450
MAMKKAVDEVRSAFGSLEDITNGPALTSCTFLRACIDEAMRLSPPVAGALPRLVLPGGLTVDGLSIPEGTDVCVPHYAIHHNPEYFPRPFEFAPERWLKDGAPADMAAHLDDAHAAFCPFSVGPRGCIGKGMAYVELTLTLARVLWQFDVRLAPGTNIGEGRPDLEEGRRRTMEYQLKDTFTSVKDGPLVQFKRRD